MDSPADSMSFWESVAKTTKWGGYIHDVKKESVLLAEKVVSDKRVLLDIGCEGGSWTQMLSEMGWTDIVCVDINRDSLAVCHRRLPYALCIQTHPDGTTFPLANESVSLLICMEVAEVINHPWSMDEFLRVLHPGGVLVGTIHNRFSHRYVLRRLRLMVSNDPEGSYYMIGYSRFRKRLKQAGFRMIYERGFCWPLFSRKSNSRLIPLFVEAERCMGLRRFPVVSPWVTFVAQKI